MTAAWTVVACALGGVGAVLRVAVTQALEGRAPGGASTATAAVNIVGSAALGAVAALGGDVALLVLGSGLLGGFTTFSTWMVEGDTLLAAGRRRAFAAVLLVPAVVGVAAYAAVRAVA